MYILRVFFLTNSIFILLLFLNIHVLFASKNIEIDSFTITKDKIVIGRTLNYGLFKEETGSIKFEYDSSRRMNTWNDYFLHTKLLKSKKGIIDTSTNYINVIAPELSGKYVLYTEFDQLSAPSIMNYVTGASMLIEIIANIDSENKIISAIESLKNIRNTASDILLMTEAIISPLHTIAESVCEIDHPFRITMKNITIQKSKIDAIFSNFERRHYRSDIKTDRRFKNIILVVSRWLDFDEQKRKTFVEDLKSYDTFIDIIVNHLIKEMLSYVSIEREIDGTKYKTLDIKLYRDIELLSVYGNVIATIKKGNYMPIDYAAQLLSSPDSLKYEKEYYISIGKYFTKSYKTNAFLKKLSNTINSLKDIATLLKAIDGRITKSVNVSNLGKYIADEVIKQMESDLVKIGTNLATQIVSYIVPGVGQAKAVLKAGKAFNTLGKFTYDTFTAPRVIPFEVKGDDVHLSYFSALDKYSFLNYPCDQINTKDPYNTTANAIFNSYFLYGTGYEENFNPRDINNRLATLATQGVTYSYSFNIGAYDKMGDTIRDYVYDEYEYFQIDKPVFSVKYETQKYIDDNLEENPKTFVSKITGVKNIETPKPLFFKGGSYDQFEKIFADPSRVEFLANSEAEYFVCINFQDLFWKHLRKVYGEEGSFWNNYKNNMGITHLTPGIYKINTEIQILPVTKSEDKVLFADNHLMFVMANIAKKDENDPNALPKLQSYSLEHDIKNDLYYISFRFNEIVNRDMVFSIADISKEYTDNESIISIFVDKNEQNYRAIIPHFLFQNGTNYKIFYHDALSQRYANLMNIEESKVHLDLYRRRIQHMSSPDAIRRVIAFVDDFELEKEKGKIIPIIKNDDTYDEEEKPFVEEEKYGEVLYTGCQAISKSINISQNTSQKIELIAICANSNEIDYIVDKKPQNGLLTVTGNVATYTPNTDFLGEDSFTYIANNGVDNSEPGVISITILDIILPEGLVVYYPFDGNAKDVSTNNYPSETFGGGLIFIDGVIGKAAKFDGSNDEIVVNNKPIINKFSYSLWINIKGFSSDHATTILHRQVNEVDNTECLRFDNPSKKIAFYLMMEDSQYRELIAGEYSGRMQEWIYLVATYDVNYMKLYDNGVLIAETKFENVQNLLQVSTPFVIGGERDYGKPTASFNGLIDDFRIYNRALTEAEIHTLYKMQKKLLTLTIPINFITEYPKDYAYKNEKFIKEWTFKNEQDIKNLKLEIINSNFNNYELIEMSQVDEQGLFTVQIELTPDISIPINKIYLQFKDQNNEVVNINKSPYFWSIIRTNHLPEIEPSETLQIVGQSGTYLTKNIMAFDKDEDVLTFSVQEEIASIATFENNTIHVKFNTDGVHTIPFIISDGKEFIERELNVLIYGTNGGIKEFYSDISQDHEYYSEIIFATLMGAVWGDTDPNDNSKRLFNPEKFVNWAEALKMVLKSAAIRGLIELPTSNFLQPDNYEKDWYWAKPYYTFARKKKAVSNGIKFSDLPTREEIGKLIVASLDLIIPKEFSNFDLSFLVFSDKEKFSENYLQFATTARLFNLFFTTNEAKPGENVKRDDLAMVISKILRMPTGEIDSEITVEYGDNLIIHGIKNLNAAKIMNLGNGVIKNEWIESPSDYIKTSIVVNRYLIINEKMINGISPVSVSTKGYELGQNHIIALIQNTDGGARNILTKEFNITFIDSDFDGIQDREDLWPYDSRYSSDINNNGIPDILDIIYELDHLTVNESLSLSQTEIPIAKIIEDGKIDYGETDCPRLTTWARNQSTGECKAFLTPCDIINGWIIDKECFSPVDFNRNNDIDLSDLIIALKILSGMEQENVQIQINERIELEDLILILNSF
jgi:hypothetical protein